MGLYLLLIGKINLLASSSSQSLSTPFLVSLLWPFIVKVAAFSFRPIHQVYTDLLYSVRLFSFQMGQITFNTEPIGPAGSRGGNTRWERAARLVCERLTHARHSRFTEADEESLRELSMIAL
ncbi:hypothetical protein K7X08_020063 [Anisodus acutangulus]|uniref:Uncharacterized protein n=1 Tax=Anisodus acutangulus TaxID=402998 RepID=A0A9Q1MAL9_9SOLA|nr:hypothetical protein K7X08_020063 [Anisodus acutangulus]